METSATESAVRHLGNTEEGREGRYEAEHLPPLLEDEENVSLADILSLQDSCLSEEEVWAVCAECVLALQSIGPSHFFHTLCITPDTLAFNAHGNVCFMEQLSDDPEGSFVPPEFDNTGSTFEGHVYSLGSSLAAALDFVIEPELQVELGDDTRQLLEQMQEEQPEDRPLPQEILSFAEARLTCTSSAAVCRKLSSIGRRVLSIESVSTFQDGPEGSWEARWQYTKTRWPLNKLSTDDRTDLGLDNGFSANGFSRQQLCRGWDPSLWAEELDSIESDAMIPREDLDCRSQSSSPVRLRPQQRSSRVRGALNRSCSVPDSNNPPCLSPIPHGDISIPVSDLTEIGSDEHLDCKHAWNNRLKELNRGKSWELYDYGGTEECMNSVVDSLVSKGNKDAVSSFCSGETETVMCSESSRAQELSQPRGSSCTPIHDRDIECSTASDKGLLNRNIYIRDNHMTKSMLCLKEESQDEWISLRELLTRCGRRLTVNELWALCYTCLSTLQTYTDFPAYLCLDTVYVGCEGEVLFLKPKNIGSCDAFYLAPEYQDHGIVTEKACVYGVAAILWATAKFTLSPHQKLAMPRKLKRLLLEMAKRTPIERPSIVVAKKICRDYLSRRGTAAETVWSQLTRRVHQTVSESADTEDQNAPDTDPNSIGEATHMNRSFVPMASESRLAPVPGPVPHSYPIISKELRLPEAFTSSATHFSPIILTQEGDSEEWTAKPAAAIDGTVKESTRTRQSQQEMQGKGFASVPHSCLTHTETGPPADKLDCPADETAMSSKAVTASAYPHVSDPSLRVSLTQLSSTCPHGCGVFNNCLLHQDPKTGCLMLVPVHIVTSESLPGLELNLPLFQNSTQGQTRHLDSTNLLTVNPEREGFDPLRFYRNDYPVTCNKTLQHAVTTTNNGAADPRTQDENESPLASCGSPKLSTNIHPALQKVIDLLKGGLFFEDYLEDGQEDPVMGQYNCSLKDLQYQTFASLVKERFRDLHWEEDLLGVLRHLVNYSPSTLASNEQPPSKSPQRAATTSPSSTTVWGQKSGAHLHGHLDPMHNICVDGSAAGDARGRTRLGETDTFQGDVEARPEENQNHVCQGVSAAVEGSAMDIMEGGDHPTGGSDESPSEADSLVWREEGLGGPPEDQMSPDCSEDMEDSVFLVSERFLSHGSSTDGSGLSFNSGWALAFYEEECFSQEVVQYALNLGQHSGSPCLDVKTQELQQQVTIETRNLKTTRNFYQKLLQQERKNKGSENKPMLAKLKSQLEELKSKLEFLDSVKKYLEILSMDQWGLDVSLLPSLVASGPSSLHLQATEDPVVLSFGTSKGKSCLQSGSPLGLMAYLYARNAVLEGYIQQFLYTYRYFCTSQQFLQFVMDMFHSVARGGPDMSENNTKIFHRSLDLFEAWVTDCKLVDFTAKSSLVSTLESFLKNEVIPLDSRGEALLATLHSSPSKRRSQGSGSPISLETSDESLSVYSSMEDPGGKWKISTVVEPTAAMPREKAFSIAAALPVPCDISGICLRNEERLPFSQSDYTAQHSAQQLTLLQQEMFLDCHPVHFLYSRIQGLREKGSSQNMNVTPHLPPAEGSSLLVCEEAPTDNVLQQLLAYAENVTNWISAEIVLCDSAKMQAALLTKFLLIGKHCYETRNFATAMQVLRGLENVIVRQLPAWKHLSTKVCEILEELRAVEVFLKSDNLCLMEREQVKRKPTLPSARILAMHIQQLEIGAFTLTSGAYKWTKLKSIAKVVSQVDAFQGAMYPYSPDRELQAYLRLRIANLSTSDIRLLAADCDVNFQPSTERQSRRIQDTLRKVKATFQ
ncbi:kinase non-catalytic C-lobe domain-containing protein 1 [Lampris incognitus]|uniref:kinase non-catalytic C-lobe domain-containing protein 1 n=1 Tax=Lampris incognitus TaxID=2546036 RepID=UPI0024B4CB64|nr:kinase non-catalytic C-lobe domain-containing protein 1 [Lampris incognitus]